VAFENIDMVTSFEFYDGKNKRRVSGVKDIVNNGYTNLEKIHSNIADLKDKLADGDV